MNDLESLITSGSIVDLIFAVLLLELVWTVASKRFTREQQIQRALHISAGFALLACLKLALIQAGWWQIALGLAIAGIIHLAEALFAQRAASPGRH
jgi:hypothetical protein